MRPDEISALLVDGWDLFRRGLRELLEQHDVRVVGERGDAAEAAWLAERTRPDVVVVDPGGPRLAGLEALRSLVAAAPDARVLVLAPPGGECAVVDAIAAGACGYLLKDAAPRDIVAGVHAAARGEAPISPRAAAELVDALRAVRGPWPVADGLELSNRELEVLRLVADGHGNDDIAVELTISASTVKHHVANLLAKLGARSRVEAAVLAVRRGLV